jgi:hypothetical protein
MGVMLTSEAEKKRVHKPSWELYSGTSIVQAVRTAKEMGWKDKKVQVRYETVDDGVEMFYVEPYEKGCGCKGILKYKDYA